jgi:hypothetical protein
MPKLIAALVLAAAALAACDVASPTTTTSSSSTPRASGSAAATRSATIAPTPTAAPTTATPAPPAPTNPPPPPPQPAITIKAVPTRGNRGTNFVFQFSGFPKSTSGLDIIQTVTLPTGVKLAPKTFSAAPNGSGLSTYTPNASDPSGQYVITLQVAGGGASAFTIITVD